MKKRRWRQKLRSFKGRRSGKALDLERRDAEPCQMDIPGGLIGEAAVGMFSQPSDHRGGQRAFAQVHQHQRLGVDDVTAIAGAHHKDSDSRPLVNPLS